MKTRHPMINTIGHFAMWGLTMLKKTFFGIGGIALLVIAGLYIAGALVESLRWYFIGTATALLLLGGGVLVLSYIRLILNRLAREQRAQVSGLNKELSVIKDDVFLIGYDILKEQNKLAEKVSQLETKASKDRKAKQPPNDSIKRR